MRRGSIEDSGFRTGLRRGRGFAFSSILNPQSALLILALYLPFVAHAGAQREEALSASVRAVLQHSVTDQAAPKLAFANRYEADKWLNEMSRRLQARMPNRPARLEFLSTVHYEATRAGLDPHLVLALIEVESGFRKYAVSRAGARGYMQVMPFWTRAIGSPEHNLFHLRMNLRYGCTILRYYLDIEKGDLHRALARYNGSLGKHKYPQRVHAVWQKKWRPVSRG
ncbi:lytic transglycosylase domain-containing protein [Ferrigenium sp. UT5]|uniref:lytic transglycosylase domain-containing protein n=1 Tax=Ferrigenium sp. UT5 TaxID=3242105 RepID=UPI0035522F4F